jgi:hypothetical protein
MSGAPCFKGGQLVSALSESQSTGARTPTAAQNSSGKILGGVRGISPQFKKKDVESFFSVHSSISN